MSIERAGGSPFEESLDCLAALSVTAMDRTPQLVACTKYGWGDQTRSLTELGLIEAH